MRDVTLTWVVARHQHPVRRAGILRAEELAKPEPLALCRCQDLGGIVGRTNEVDKNGAAQLGLNHPAAALQLAVVHPWDARSVRGDQPSPGWTKVSDSDDSFTGKISIWGKTFRIFAHLFGGKIRFA